MKKMLGNIIFFISLISIPHIIYGKDNVVSNPFFNNSDTPEVSKTNPANIAPILTATGNQFFCPGSSVKIVTNFTITDPDDTGIDALYIQISSGYDLGQDVLTLTGSHPNINAAWNSTTAVLTLTGVSSIQPTYVELIAAVKDIEFSSSSPSPSGQRNFSISVGQANYLPSNGHYYLFVPNIGITWTNAKIAAENSNYYGLHGYLATITSAEEAQIAGEQTTGAGWIGGSDADIEGTWKWMTGPELGIVFWTGNFTGFTSNFAFWNVGEPNSTGDEDYAHITAPGVGTPGSWNDLSNTGETGTAYEPKGYIVEYGGMPGDPILSISASTTLTIPSISSTIDLTRCGPGTADLQAASNIGLVNWYDVAIGGTPIGTGNNFTTPNLSTTSVFYAVAHIPGCPDLIRKAVTVTVKPKPVLAVTTPFYMCNEAYTVIDIPISVGVMFWYDSPTSTTPLFSGPHFIVPNIHQTSTFYAEANYDSCISDRISFLVEVYPSPIVPDETYELCEGDRIILDAGNPGMTYLWSTGETTSTILSNGLTTYSVEVTTPEPQSCSKTKNFIISYHTQPIISSIDILGLTATINTTQSGDFEYSLDGVDYQNSNIFTLVEGGSYIGYVREKNGCGIDQKPFISISYPDFFTPNGDGINDTWSVKGGSSFSNAKVSIFDRFGKLITVLNTNNPNWDGTFNGKLLPADDYWFIAKINDLFPEKKGHFSLKR